MFEIFFGLIWTMITAFVTFGFYAGTAATIRVNGELVSQAEFNGMLFPKIFLGIFWVIGITMIVIGIKKIIKNSNTEKFGEVCYGRIISISKTGAYVNGVPQLKALITVYIESNGEVTEVEEVIGLATNRKYNVGDYVEGKYYNGDINISSYVPETMIPSYIQSRFKDLVKTEDTITIDGVEYVRKDSIDLK